MEELRCMTEAGAKGHLLYNCISVTLERQRFVGSEEKAWPHGSLKEVLMLTEMFSSSIVAAVTELTRLSPNASMFKG